MALDGAILYQRGTNQPGQQPNGRSAQYQLSGKNGLASTQITPYDSGSIVAVHGPGKAPGKLVNGTIQNATDLVCNSSPLGNTLTSSNQPTSLGVPIVNPAQAASAGLSLSPEHE